MRETDECIDIIHNVRAVNEGWLAMASDSPNGARSAWQANSIYVTWCINIIYMACPYLMYCDAYCEHLYLEYKLLSYMLLYMVYSDHILSRCVHNI